MQILQTQRLSLREFVPEDVNALAAILSDLETARYKNDGYGLWAMILNSTGELIGDCGLVRQTVDGTDEVEIGYHVRRDQWGHGYASEAARACRDYGFANLKVDKLISLIRPENIASRRVAEKNGMTIWKEVTRVNLLHYVYAIRRNRVGAGVLARAE
jgi:RimJ/RimL family protein N-acetyltransferase